MKQLKRIKSNLNREFYNTINDNVTSTEENFIEIKGEVGRVQTQLDNVVVKGDSSPAADQARIDANNVVKSSLKKRLDDDYREVVTQLSNKATKEEISNIGNASPKGTYSTLSALQTAFPTGTTGIYVVTEDGKWYYWNGSAWTAGGVYQSTGIGAKSVDTPSIADRAVTKYQLDRRAIVEEHIDFPVIYSKKSKNMIDVTKVTKNYYVSAGNGRLIASSGFNVTDFINVTPNTDYVYNGDEQIAFYDKNKMFVSGINRNEPRNLFTSFRTPTNAYLVRLTVREADIASRQLQLGTVPTRFELFKAPIELETMVQKSEMTDLLMHLQNPFIPTKVKLIGSSTIAGNGGTGYSATGELIMVDSNGVSRYANVESAYCWANEFKKNVEQSYNKEFYIDSNHPNIKVYGYDGTYGTSSGSLTGLRWSFGNTINNYTLMEYDFYGDYTKILYFKSGFSGIFSVYVDGVLHGTVDTYNAAQQNNVEYTVSNLTLGTHNVKIVGENSKNSNSTQNNVFIQGIKVKKHVLVKNWGVSGSNSEFLKNNVDVWVQNDDDFVFIQTGSNDREKTPDDFTRSLLTFAINRIKNRGKKCYILSFAPPSQANDNNAIHKMDSINRRLREVAVETDSPFIDIYSEFLDYMYWTGTTFESLTADGLHVNDKGYSIMLRKITKELGVSINRTNLL